MINIGRYSCHHSWSECGKHSAKWCNLTFSRWRIWLVLNSLKTEEKFWKNSFWLFIIGSLIINKILLKIFNRVNKMLNFIVLCYNSERGQCCSLLSFFFSLILLSYSKVNQWSLVEKKIEFKIVVAQWQICNMIWC